MGQSIEITGAFSSLEGFQTREDWGAKQTIESRINAVVIDAEGYYDTIAIHHTERSSNERMISLQMKHQKRYADVGYHFVISADGTIYEGRPIEYKGEHIALNNTGKIGISLMGNFQEGGESFYSDFTNSLQGANPKKPKSAQIESLKQFVKILDLVYGMDSVGGHRDFTVSGHPSSCPGNLCYPILVEENIVNVGQR